MQASINDVKIADKVAWQCLAQRFDQFGSEERRFIWDLGRRPDDFPGLKELDERYGML